jgi:hypothetical protein
MLIFIFILGGILPTYFPILLKKLLRQEDVRLDSGEKMPFPYYDDKSMDKEITRARTSSFNRGKI